MEKEEWCGCKTRGGIIVKFCKKHFESYWGNKKGSHKTKEEKE